MDYGDWCDERQSGLCRNVHMGLILVATMHQIGLVSKNNCRTQPRRFICVFLIKIIKIILTFQKLKK